MADRPGRAGPRYRDIADDLRAQIASGELKPDDKLPSRAELARKHGVAQATVERAIEVLRQEELVESFQGAGIYVRKVPGTEPTMAERVARLEREMKELRPQVDLLDCQMQDTRAAVGLEQWQPDDQAQAQ